jgi:protein involved in polysaccharide export with SLBB domain
MMPFIILVLLTQRDIFLLPNDAVEVKIWRQEDVSGWYYVDADTNLNIPLLGKFPVSNVVIDSLDRLLINRFRNYYGDVLLNVNFYYRINIFGEVKSPGFYYVRREDNLANLLAQAGGPTERGSLGGIRILNLGMARTVNFETILKSGDNIDDLNLRPGDVVIVPRRFIAGLQEWSVIFTLGTLILQIYSVAK